MTPTQIRYARSILAERLPENGRTAKRSELTRRKLSKEIGRDKDYINDFIIGRKESLGAAEIWAIEAILNLPAGGLLGPVAASETLSGEIILVPKISWVSAGELAAADAVEDLSAAPRIAVPNLPKGDWIALEVVGDSMDRISPPGSIIFVDRSDKTLITNRCYIFADDEGGATYKRYRASPDRLEPVSVNREHEPHYPEHMPAVIGRVRRSVYDL